LGFGNWQATVATISGLIAKENVVGTMAVLYPGNFSAQIAVHFTAITTYSYMIFNLLCAPCFAAIGAIKREMNNTKWTLGAVGYMCLWAYVVSLVVYQIGGLIAGEVAFGFWTIVAVALIIGVVYMLFRKGYQEEGESRRLTSVAAAAK
jgi:ferrous iron transport protein B